MWHTWSEIRWSCVRGWHAIVCGNQEETNTRLGSEINIFSAMSAWTKSLMYGRCPGGHRRIRDGLGWAEHGSRPEYWPRAQLRPLPGEIKPREGRLQPCRVAWGGSIKSLCERQYVIKCTNAKTGRQAEHDHNTIRVPDKNIKCQDDSSTRPGPGCGMIGCSNIENRGSRIPVSWCVVTQRWNYRPV